MSTANDSRDLALIGAGYWGKNLARNFHALGALRTLCDRSEATLASYGVDFGDVRKSTSFEAVLADPAVRKVAIAAPAVLHNDLARAALAAGKDVFVEKPLCLDVSEGMALAALARERGRILMVGHLLQYHPCIDALQRHVAQGTLGKVQYITSNRLNLGKIRQEENALWSFAPHDISVILSLVGGQLPQQIRCTGGTYLTPKVADTTLTTLKFDDGVRAHVFVSWLNPFKEQKLTVVGSCGMMVFDDTKPWKEKLVLHRDYLSRSEGRTPVPSKAQAEFVAVAESEPLRAECQHFLDCCRDRTTPRTDAAEGLRVLQVLKAAQASLDSDGDAVTPQGSAAPAYFSHPTAIVDPSAKIGARSKVWHFSHVMARAELGEGCNLGQNVVISPDVKLGRNVKIQNNVSIYTGTIVEDDVFFGPSCVLTNVSNPRSEVNRRNLYEKTVIRRGATIGANATIVCGVTLGRYCFVGAGAVVTRDVPDYALVVGSPARQKGWMSRHGHPLQFHGGSVATCPESNLRYERVDEQIHCIDQDEGEPLPAALQTGRVGYREVNTRNRRGAEIKPSPRANSRLPR
jgi:UDP-2-acetamido-3-amino-2,3-dideoxy-glucuronate N-acetyltransferase